MSLASDANELGTRAGTGYIFIALATLTGTPIAGVLLETSGGRYTAPLLFAGTTMLLGSGMLVVFRRVRIARSHHDWKI